MIIDNKNANQIKENETFLTTYDDSDFEKSFFKTKDVILGKKINGMNLVNKSNFYKDSDNFPLVIGHRGMYHEIQNSLNCFKKCYEAGIFIIELDVWLTKDEIPVIIHCDGKTKCISETSNGKGKVEDFTFEEIGEFNLEGKNEKIPSLEEVFELYNENFRIIIEIKEHNKKELITKKVIDLINKYKMYYKVVVSSFDTDYYQILRNLDSNIEFKFNIHTDEELSKVCSMPIEYKKFTSICLVNKMCNFELIKAFHESCQSVSVYFESEFQYSDENMKNYFEMDIDHFIVDYPLIVKTQILNYFSKLK